MPGHEQQSAILRLIACYRPAEERKLLEGGNFRLTHIPCDWSLNRSRSLVGRGEKACAGNSSYELKSIRPRTKCFLQVENYHGMCIIANSGSLTREPTERL